MIYANRRCAPTPACWCATGAASRACGAMRSPATCRSCWCRSADAANIDLVRQLVQAHAWWRLKGLAVDLVIWNEERDGYRQRLQEQILGLIAGRRRSARDRSAGRHLRAPRRADLRTRTACCCRRSRASVVQRQPRHAGRAGERGAVRADGASPRLLADPRAPRREPRGRRAASARRATTLAARQRHRRLLGRRPRVRDPPRAGDATTPAPWVNVLANPRFGTVVSESGSAYTWCENAHEFRLTPWHNDPVGDAGGEAIYLRDEESGAGLVADSLPARAAPSAVRHAPRLRLQRVRARRGRHPLANCGFRRARRGGEVLGAARLAQRVGPRRDGCRRPAMSNGCSATCGRSRRCTSSPRSTPTSGALFARNPYNNEFADRIGFFDVDDAAARRLTGDRTEFIGRNGTLRDAGGAGPPRLSGTARRRARSLRRASRCRSSSPTARNARSCSGSASGRRHRAMRATLVAALPRRRRRARSALDEGAAATGAARSARCRSRRPTRRSTCSPTAGCCTRRSPAASGRAAATTSPAARSASATSCRTRWRWCTRSRSCCASSCCSAPRASSPKATSSTGGIRRRAAACARASPTTTCGCRSRCRYVDATGDTGVLDEVVPFLEGRAVNADEESYYDLPGRLGRAGDLYEHCAARDPARPALRRARPAADGLRRLERRHEPGRQRGRGESVWLGFFLCEVLHRFGALARAARRRRTAPSAAWRSSEAARATSTTHAWDGAWYRRAWFDDGTPLGSAGERRMPDRLDRAELVGAVGRRRCRTRARSAMDAVDERLVRREPGWSSCSTRRSTTRR